MRMMFSSSCMAFFARVTAVSYTHLGGDLFRILTEEPYGDDFDSTASRAQTELNNETRPALSTHIDPDRSHRSPP